MCLEVEEDLYQCHLLCVRALFWHPIVPPWEDCPTTSRKPPYATGSHLGSTRGSRRLLMVGTRNCRHLQVPLPLCTMPLIIGSMHYGIRTTSTVLSLSERIGVIIRIPASFHASHDCCKYLVIRSAVRSFSGAPPPFIVGSSLIPTYGRAYMAGHMGCDMPFVLPTRMNRSISQ